MTSVFYMVCNGRIENTDNQLMTIGVCHNVSKRFPRQILLRDYKQYMNDTEPTKARYAENVDWFVWEPVDSARRVRRNASTQLTPRELAAPVLTGDRPFTLSVPFGRFGEASKEISLDKQATLQQLLEAVSGVYMGKATMEDVEAVCAKKGKDDEYTQRTRDALAAGKQARIVDLCGSCEYSISETDDGRVVDSVTGESRRPSELGFRHPFGDCMGRVRFEGLEREDADTLCVLMGS